MTNGYKLLRKKDEVVTNCDHLINELNFQELEVL